MADAPLTADELSLARDSLVRSLPGLFEANSQIVSMLGSLYLYDLGLDYYTKYPQQVGAVTSAGVQDVAKRYLVPQKMIVVAVGDRVKVVPQLREVGLGSLEPARL